MFRKLGFVMLPLALLLAAACGGGSSKDEGATAKATSEPTASRPAATATVAQPPTATVAAAPTAVPTKEAAIQSGGNPLFGSFSPFQMMGAGLGSAPGALVADDPALSAVLLQDGDLPAGFQSMGSFTYDAPIPEGNAKTAASVFASGDIANGQFGAMVMSMAMALPPDALAQMGDLGQVSGLSQADLDQINQEASVAGLSLKDLRVLDASGLGEKSAAWHMAMDFSALMEGFGAGSEGAMPWGNALAADMYMFVRGDRMMMVMVMWPDGQEAGVNGGALARVMDGRASS